MSPDSTCLWVNEKIPAWESVSRVVFKLSVEHVTEYNLLFMQIIASMLLVYGCMLQQSHHIIELAYNGRWVFDKEKSEGNGIEGCVSVSDCIRF